MIKRLERLVLRSRLGYLVYRVVLWWHYCRDCSEIDSAIKKYCGDGLSNVQFRRMRRRVRSVIIRYGWCPMEYFVYNYDAKTPRERRQMVGEFEKHWFAFRVNSQRSIQIFNQKWDTYQHFKKYYGREIIKVTKETHVSEFDEFVKNHNSFILKPLSSSMGRGVRKVDVQQDQPIDSLFNSLLEENPKGFLAEELIIQDPSMAILHPQSVNTMRVNTLRTKDGVLVFKPSIRIGRGDSVVDNAGAGGIFAKIDENTGEIEKVFDEYKHLYEVHPDTGFKLIGYRVPHMDEAKALAAELMDVLQDCAYVGWDLGLTPNGWVMVEGNVEAQFTFQIFEECGFRDDFSKILKQIKINRGNR